MLHVDLPEAIDKGELSLFADDTNVYCIGQHVEEVTDKLNVIMSQIHDWCMNNKLTVHPGKSEAMMITKTPFIGPLRPLKYGDNFVKFVTATNCLGLEIDNKLSWNVHIKKVSKNFSQKLGALKRMNLPRMALEEIYFKTVISKVTYCISVWGNCSVPLFKTLESIHARAARFIYSLPKTLSDEESIVRANWQPLSYIYKRRLLTVMHKVYYNTGDEAIQSLFIKSQRNENQFTVQRSNTEHGRNSLKYRGTVIWNVLPDSLKRIEHNKTFKNNLKRAIKVINNVNFTKGTTFVLHRMKDFTYF